MRDIARTVCAISAIQMPSHVWRSDDSVASINTFIANVASCHKHVYYPPFYFLSQHEIDDDLLLMCFGTSYKHHFAQIKIKFRVAIPM